MTAMEQCRTCGHFSHDTHNWFELFPKRKNKDIEQFVDMLELWEIEVYPGEDLPNKVCDTCYIIALQIKMFRDKCTSTDMVFRGTGNIMLNINTTYMDDIDDKTSESDMEHDEDDNETQKDAADGDDVETEEFHYTDPIKWMLHRRSHKLDRHAKLEPNPLICHLCLSNEPMDVMYDTVEERQAHEALVHSDPKIFKCLICNDFVDRVAAPFHLSKAHKIRGITCYVCGKFVVSLSKHIEKHYTSDFTCDICGMVFNNTSKKCFEYHMRWHDPAQQLKCPVAGCDKVCVQKPHLLAHLVTHNNVGTFFCRRCGKDFATQMLLDEHDKKDHKQLVSKSKQRRLAVRKGRIMRGIYSCQHCTQTFHSESTLAAHQVKHCPDGRPFACDQCYSFFKSSSNLRTHKQLVHSDERPYTCVFCHKSFTFQYSLNEHLQTHSGQTFKCELCERKFTTIRLYTTHMTRYHNEAKMLKCDYCDKKFNERYQVQMHMRKDHRKRYYMNAQTETERAIKSLTKEPTNLGQQVVVMKKVPDVITAKEEIIKSGPIILSVRTTSIEEFTTPAESTTAELTAPAEKAPLEEFTTPEEEFTTQEEEFVSDTMEFEQVLKSMPELS